MSNEAKKMAIDSLSFYEEKLLALSDEIWEYAEPKFEEYRSAEAICRFLEEAGFSVERGVAGIPTAFTGTYGSGRPVIGILGEYDALEGLSQEAGCAVPKSIGGSCGHGCGHNTLATSTLAGALIAKSFLEKNDIPGTIIYFGCPAEEGGSGKAFMVREKLFEGVDIALSDHPAGQNCVRTGTTCASVKYEYVFHGIKSHPAAQPEAGRSAFDALELFNIAIQYLREHIPQGSYLHYAVTFAGGDAPNVIPDLAKGTYVIRSKNLALVNELDRRMDLCAQGAALATETTYERRKVSAGNNLISTEAVEEVLQANFEEAEMPVYTEEEQELGWSIFRSSPRFADSLDVACQFSSKWKGEFETWQREHPENAFNNFVCSRSHTNELVPGATDLAEVSWVVPTASIFYATGPKKVPVHTWQFTALAKTSIAHKGLLMAGRVLGGAAIDYFENPALVEKAWESFKKELPGPYICPVDDIEPDLPEKAK